MENCKSIKYQQIEREKESTEMPSNLKLSPDKANENTDDFLGNHLNACLGNLIVNEMNSPQSTLDSKINEKLNIKIFIVGGLLFGDEGKGTTVEYLSHTYNANLVVRYGGGPQAAHHIVLSNGIWHCFSQLGSSSFEKNCSTLLSKFMLINPMNLEREIEVFCKKGVSEAEILSRLFIDKSCFIITPYHKLVNVAKEILRKNANHGSTGLGVGVAIDDAMYSDNGSFFLKAEICLAKEKQIENKDRNYAHFNYNCSAIQVSDFYDRNLLFKKLRKLIDEKTEHVNFLIEEYYAKNDIDKDFSTEDKYVKEVRSTLEKFKNDFSLVKLLKIYVDWFNKYSNNNIFIDNSAKFILEFNKQNQYKRTSNISTRNIVFEGSQGSLLDRIHGFYPHITKTLCSSENAEALINEIKTADDSATVETFKVGVLRAYASRHGKGPFVTESDFWNLNMKELHNDFGRFQGGFRLGPFDLIGARYGIEIFKPDFLSMTCVDRIVEKIDKANFTLADEDKENKLNCVKEKGLIEYQDKIESVDFYYCEFYLLDFLRDENTDQTEKHSNKHKKKTNKNFILNNERMVNKFFYTLNELKEKGILELMEFENKEKLDNFLIENLKTYKVENKEGSFSKRYIINSNKALFSKYEQHKQKLILLTRINKGEDFYNFKNENLTKILEKAKGIYYKFYQSESNLLEISANQKKNFLLAADNTEEQNNFITKFFDCKLSKYPNYNLDYVYHNLINLERELKIPIKVISLGPTKEDKLLLKKVESLNNEIYIEQKFFDY